MWHHRVGFEKKDLKDDCIVIITAVGVIFCAGFEWYGEWCVAGKQTTTTITVLALGTNRDEIFFFFFFYVSRTTPRVQKDLVGFGLFFCDSPFNNVLPPLMLPGPLL